MTLDDCILTRLAEIRAAGTLPEDLVTLVEGVLPLQRAALAEARVELPAPEACASAEAMFAGSPLLLRASFPHDMPQALALFPKLLELLLAAGAPAQELAQAVASGELAPADVLRAHLAGYEPLFAAWRSRLPQSPRALDFLAVSSLWPGLNAGARALAQRLPENLPHEHGHCPLCGSLPYITLVRGKEGARFGVCSFCGFEHRIRRIACPYCDEGDTGKLKLFRVAEHSGIWVEVCGTCSMYSKTLDCRELACEPMPALEDMASTDLDALAQAEGYRRPVFSAWGF